MSQFDIKYKNMVERIYKEGIWDTDQQVRPKWADGTPAHTLSIVSHQITIDNTETPILTQKYVAWKLAIKELLRFYVERSNNVEGLGIWDEWMRKDGTIGRAYGHQLGKSIIEQAFATAKGAREIGMDATYTNQIDKLIKGLKKDPASRRHIISLWNIDDLWDMALYPCVWNHQFLVKQGKLHLIVGIRSNDVALGNPFNVFQFHVWQRMVAQVTGYEVGTLTFNINDCHIYSRHIDGLKEQISREPFAAPNLWINPAVKNIEDFTIDDFKLEGYTYHPSIKFEVAI